MINYREILRLYHQGISSRGIAASLPCSRNTVSRVIGKAESIGLSWPLPEKTTNEMIEDLLFPEYEEDNPQKFPDYEYIHKELAKNGVTLSLLWHEYSEQCRNNQKIPYQYTQFCKYYHDYAQKAKATMRIQHKPAEKIEVDWAGQAAMIIDNITGEPIKAYIFVAALPYSCYSYAEAFLSMNMDSWIQAHINAFSYFCGVARILIPDNLKTGVSQASLHSPVINKTYQEMAEYYQIAVLPARVRHPKDKASAESAVGVVSIWIVASLRNQIFFRLSELNLAIREKLAEFNRKPFQKKEGSRESVFLTEEQPLLLPLPPMPFELAVWTKATVPFNYHICAEKMYYSVPYEYIKHTVDIRTTIRTIEVFYHTVRVASHVRKFGNPGQYQTLPEHMPEQHQRYQEWNAERFISWAAEIGENTITIVKFLLTSCRVEQQGYRSCASLLKLADKYSVERLERACQRALSYTARPSYKNVKTILKTGADEICNKSESARRNSGNEFGIIRGSDYYGRTDK